MTVKWGECHNDACDEPCPWDMSGIILFDEVYCSPDCAKAGLEAMVDRPGEVSLHDPQYVVDREDLGLSRDHINITRAGSEPAEKKIEAIAELFPVEFRVTP